MTGSARRLVAAAVLLVAGSGCRNATPTPDPGQHERTIATIDSLHAVERRAHIGRDAELLVSLLADDYTMVDGGEVTRPSRAETLQRFREYFGSVRFLRWDDLAQPLIRVSRDGTLAAVTVLKRVDLVSAADSTAQEHEVFAWLEVWEQRPEGWRIVAIASTRTPGEEKAEPSE